MKARTVNRINSVSMVWSFSLVLIFGLVFSFFALKATQQKIPENYVQADARITRIEEELSPTFVYSDKAPEPSDYDHHVFVTYSYGGKTYANLELGRYSSSMKEGDTVALYFDPADPADFMGDPSENVTFLIVGIVVVLIGLGGLAYCVYQKKKRSMN